MGFNKSYVGYLYIRNDHFHDCGSLPISIEVLVVISTEELIRPSVEDNVDTDGDFVTDADKVISIAIKRHLVQYIVETTALFHKVPLINISIFVSSLWMCKPQPI